MVKKRKTTLDVHFFLLFLRLILIGIPLSQLSSSHYSGVNHKGNKSKNFCSLSDRYENDPYVSVCPFRFGLFFGPFKNQTYDSLSSFRIPSASPHLSYRRAQFGANPDEIFSFWRNVFLKQTIFI